MGQQLRKIAKRKRLKLRGKRKKESVKLAKANPSNKALKAAKGDAKPKKKAPAAKKTAAPKKPAAAAEATPAPE